jgi:hypothetical protein
MAGFASSLSRWGWCIRMLTTMSDHNAIVRAPAYFGRPGEKRTPRPATVSDIPGVPYKPRITLIRDRAV